MTKKPPPGIGIDSSGGGVIDPTENVIDLVEAANKRQDDLRIETNKRVDAEIACLRDMLQAMKDHLKEMAGAETRRLDAIRQVDVLAVNTAAERSAAAINTLASTTATNAENLRNALNATATTLAAQLTNTVSQLTERISALEKSSYEGKGRSTATDPQMIELLAEMKALRTTDSTRSGFDAGKAAAVAAAGVIGGGGIAALVMQMMR